MPRARQSTAAPASTAHRLPDYEPPTHALNPKAQRALNDLLRQNKLRTLHNHFEAAADLLSSNAHDVNEILQDRQRYTAKAHAKADRDGNADPDNEARLAALDAHLEEVRTRAEKLTQKMEESIRKVIDAEHSAHAMEDGLRNIPTNSVNQVAQTQRTTRRGTQPDGEEEEEEEEMPDFDPTDPGATARSSAQKNPSFNLKQAFTTHLEEEKDKYQTHSLTERYASNNRYASFKRSVHDGMYPGDDGPPLPHKSTWFKEGNEPAPGETAVGDASDDDIAVARERISTKCPLTLREFDDVVTSTKCKHSFERSAIMSLMTHGHARPMPVQCPVPGCDKQLAQADLKVDPVLVRKIRRIQKSRRTQMESEILESSPQGGKGRAESVGSDSGEDIDEVERRTQIPVKQEPRSSRPVFKPNEPGGTQVVDLGGDGEETGSEEEDKA